MPATSLNSWVPLDGLTFGSAEADGWSPHFSILALAFLRNSGIVVVVVADGVWEGRMEGWGFVVDEVGVVSVEVWLKCYCTVLCLKGVHWIHREASQSSFNGSYISIFGETRV